MRSVQAPDHPAADDTDTLDAHPANLIGRFDLVAAVLFALCSALAFGSLAVTLNFALRRCPDAELGAFATTLAALIPVGLVALARFDWSWHVWPYLLAGLLAPGSSQIFYVVAIREAGSSRTALVVGAAPLVSVTIALAAFGEPVSAPLIVGAVLIVLGGIALARERVRPETFRAIGLVLAFGSAAFFATRDNVVRRLATHEHVSPELAAAATIVSGGALIALYLMARRGPRGPVRGLGPAFAAFAPSGTIWGLSYVFLFEAFSRGRVSIVSPLVAIESLVGIVLAALVLGRSELIGRDLWIGAALIVAGGALISGFR
jgi:drug/metabolite transporter (DMT)-like permease